MPPTSPGKYALLAELGRGGMATAYLASMQGPGGFSKLVVIKRLRPALAIEPEFLRMFLQEARLAARIDHPNVVHTTEVGFDGENYFIAMEYLEGQSLENLSRRVITRAAGLSIPPPSSTASNTTTLGATPTATSAVSVLGAAIPLRIHLFILTQVLAGLDYAHELKDFDGNPLNVVHRDVSPHNVMVTYEGHVKLVDFGIAKAADSNGDTRTGVMKGKCAYMPAEQFGGKVDRRADVFAVGVMLWQALTGRRLWKGLSDAEVFQRLSRDDIPTPSSVKEGIDPELEAICMKALSYRPDDRWSTAADFQAAIEDVVAGDKALRATPRETGKYVAELFATDREKVRRVIEEELGSRNTDAATNVHSLPTLASTTGTGSVPAASTSSLFGPTTARAASTGSTTIDTPPAEPPQPRRMLRVATIGAVAVAALAVLVVAMRQPSAPVAGGSAATTALAPVGSAAPEAPLAVSRVSLTTTPPGAQIMIDGARVEGEPVTFERDGKRHRVQVDAEGFQPHAEWMVFDKDAIEIKLSKSEAASRPARFGGPRAATPAKNPTQAEAAPATPAKEPEKTPPATNTAKPNVGLDKGDPWAK